MGPVSYRNHGADPLLVVATGGQDGAENPAQESSLAGPANGLCVLRLTLGLGNRVEQAAQTGLGFRQNSPGLHAVGEDRIGRPGSGQLPAESLHLADLLRIEL